MSDTVLETVEITTLVLVENEPDLLLISETETLLLTEQIQGPRGIQGLPGQDSTVPGPKGDKGDTGPQNLFVQATQPVYAGQAVWFKTNMPGGGVDILIQTGA